MSLIGTHLNRLAIDPGVSVGMAMRLNGKFSVWLVEAGNAKEVVSYIAPVLDEVIYERFATSQRVDHYGLLTVEMCGAIQGATWVVNSAMEAEWSSRFTTYTVPPTPSPHRLTLVRHEPANRIAFVEEAKDMVRAFFASMGEKPDPQIMDDGVSATAHLLCREQLGDDVRKHNYGKGISNA